MNELAEYWRHTAREWEQVSDGWKEASRGWRRAFFISLSGQLLSLAYIIWLWANPR